MAKQLSLNIEEFTKGVCFICKNPIAENPDAYCHYDCAICYCEEKAKRAKQAMERRP